MFLQGMGLCDTVHTQKNLALAGNTQTQLEVFHTGVLVDSCPNQKCISRMLLGVIVMVQEH